MSTFEIMAAPSKLSKNVLQMKFMQRSVLRLEKEQNEDESLRAVDDEHWVMDIPLLPKKECRHEKEPSQAVCENLIFGRMSFKGFNPEVEKLMRIQNNEREQKAAVQKEKEEKEKETTVNDKEMAKRYSSLVGIIAKKFAKKRQRHEMGETSVSNEGLSAEKRNRTFLKPTDV